MSPRQADPQVRAALVETAARLLAEGGPDLLTLRRLTKEVGTSTMAVYTHFGSMDDLRAEVAREGFDRLRRRLRTVEPSDDPMADLGAATPGAAGVAGVGYDTFLILVDGVQRCIDAGRFHPADPLLLATQVWAGVHGAVALAHAGLLDPDELERASAASARNLFVGFGDDRARVSASFSRAGRGTE